MAHPPLDPAENTNRLIREHLPKGTSFTAITDAQVQDIQGCLNRRPCIVLNGQTPTETLNDTTHHGPTDPERPGTFHAAGCMPLRVGTSCASGDRIAVPDGVEHPRRRCQILFDPRAFGARPHSPRNLGPPAPTRMTALPSPHPTIQ